MRNKKFWDTTSGAKVTGRMQIWGTWEKEREKKGGMGVRFRKFDLNKSLLPLLLIGFFFSSILMRAAKEKLLVPYRFPFAQALGGGGVCISPQDQLALQSIVWA